MDLFKLDEILHEMEDARPPISIGACEQQTTGGLAYRPVQMHTSTTKNGRIGEVSTSNEALDDFGEPFHPRPLPNIHLGQQTKEK